MSVLWQVSFMGLETVGFAKTNLKALWIDPLDYIDQLEQAVQILQLYGIHVAIFNLQRCILPKTLIRLSQQSISEWKNEYLDLCAECTVRTSCCGFFSGNRAHYSRGIQPIR